MNSTSMVLTGLTHKMPGDQEQVQYFLEKIPQRRIGKPGAPGWPSA